MTPLFGCQNDACASEVSYELDMLAEWNGLPICENCYWEEDKPEDAPLWSDLPKCDPCKIVLPAGYAVVKALPVEDQNIRALEKVGYAVVPVEPTEAMANAALHAVRTTEPPEPDTSPVEGVRALWQAMLAAAKVDP